MSVITTLSAKDMGVRPTQLTIKQPALQKLSLIMICSKIYKICMNVEMCEMCRPDTYALIPQRLAGTSRKKEIDEVYKFVNLG